MSPEHYEVAQMLWQLLNPGSAPLDAQHPDSAYYLSLADDLLYGSWLRSVVTTVRGPIYMHSAVMIAVAGMPTVCSVVGLEYGDADGTLHAKITRNDGKMWQLGGDQSTEIRAKWVPASELVPMGGN